ncbi:MAG: c-type cytochrome [Planctomycetota bacterium]
MLKTLRDDSADMQERDAAVKYLAKSRAGAMAMIEMAQKKDEFPDEMRSSAALALGESDDADVLKLAEKFIPLPKMKDGTRIPPISKLVEMKGDIAAGRAIFRSSKGPNCMNCHQLEGLGREIGPPISTIGEKPKEVLYETILAPSASIQHGFEAYTVRKKDGTVITGLKVEETDEKFTIKNSDGDLVDIPAAEIKKTIKEKKSLMPEKLIETMTTKDLVDLVEYLSDQKVK